MGPHALAICWLAGLPYQDMVREVTQQRLTAAHRNQGAAATAHLVRRDRRGVGSYPGGAGRGPGGGATDRRCSGAQ